MKIFIEIPATIQPDKPGKYHVRIKYKDGNGAFQNEYFRLHFDGQKFDIQDNAHVVTWLKEIELSYELTTKELLDLRKG
jgi:hypothetical protein